MSKSILAVLTTVPGQGSTTFACSLAWTLASQGKSVLIIDLDMSGMGTVADQFNITRGEANVYSLLSSRSLTPSQIEDQAVADPKLHGLRIVPGLPAYPGTSIAKLLPMLKPALAQLPDDYVILDLGAPLCYPESTYPVAQVAEIISSSVQRVLITIQDSPTLMVASINLLKNARFPSAELIYMQTRGGKMRKTLIDTVRDGLPGLSIAATVQWNPSLIMAAEDAGEPAKQSVVVSHLSL